MQANRAFVICILDFWYPHATAKHVAYFKTNTVFGKNLKQQQ